MRVHSAKGGANPTDGFFPAGQPHGPALASSELSASRDFWSFHAIAPLALARETATLTPGFRAQARGPGHFLDRALRSRSLTPLLQSVPEQGRPQAASAAPAERCTPEEETPQ